MENSLYIVYLILQNKYLQMCGLDILDEEKVLLNMHNFFPENWEIDYKLEERKDLMIKAIKEKKNLKSILEERRRNN